MSCDEALSPPKSGRSRLADIVLGCDAVQRRAIKRMLIFASAYAALWALLALAVVCGVAQVATLSMASFAVIGQILFYGVLRSGATLRMKDPMLCFPQALYGLAVVALTYGLKSAGQGPPLQVLFLILAYDLHRLSQRQIARLAAFAAILLAGVVVVKWSLRPESTSLPKEAFGMLMAVVAMPALAEIARLVRSVYQRRLAQAAELAKTLGELRTLSQRDALTGAFNRGHMADLMGEELKRTQRTGRPFSVAMLDIDYFKRINDEFGHAAGDAVLQRMTAMARDALPGTALVARWGGEEFLVLLPEASAATARQAIEHLKERVAAHDWTDDAAGLRMTFSSGIAEHASSFTLEQTIARADAALYRAKEGGRDRVEVDAAVATAAALEGAGAASTCVAAPRATGRPAAVTAVKAAPVPRHRDAATDDAASDRAGSPPQVAARAGSDLAARGHALVRVGDLILGRDPTMRLSTQLCLVGSALYACWIAAHVYSERAGYMTPGILPFAVVYYVVGMLAFYLLVRSGRTARLQDSGLVQAQILWGASALMMVYPFNPTLRAAMMATLCLQQLFGLFALRPRRLIATGGAIVGIQLVMLAAAAWLRPVQFDVREEAFSVLNSCFVIGLITWISVLRSRDKARTLARRKELDAAVDQVDDLVRHDALTGLFNRKHMQGLLERERARQSQTGQAFCVALIDLDHFKSVNDTHGHQVGDEVLRSFAGIAQASLRETDTIARWGGEEFLVLLPDTASETDGKVSMDRLHRAVEAAVPSATVPTLRVTFSAGLSVHEEGAGIEQTLERADRALYRSKAMGRHRTTLASQLAECIPPACGQDSGDAQRKALRQFV